MPDAFLAPLGLSVYALAKAINVARSRVDDIVLGRRAISADTALRLARYFAAMPEFRVDLQARDGLALARQAQSRIEKKVTPRAA